MICLPDSVLRRGSVNGTDKSVAGLLECAASIPEPKLMPLLDLPLLFERRAGFCRGRASVDCLTR